MSVTGIQRVVKICFDVCGCLFFYPPTHTFFGSSRHVTHLAYTWTCVCNEPEIKVRQHSREDIKVIYDPGRCYENLPFYFFFYFLFSKNPRLCTLDPRHVTLDPRLCTLDPRLSTKTQTRLVVSAHTKHSDVSLADVDRRVSKYN